MKRVIIIDDEPLAISVVREYLEHYSEFEVVGECQNGFQGAKAINELKPDLVFLDVQMPKITGLEMLELLDHMPSIIFTTAFDEYAIHAFEANATDYLLKPFDRERMDKAVKKYLNASASDSITPDAAEGLTLSRLVLKDGGDISILALDEVEYLQADDDYVHIHTKEKRFVKKATLKYYESRLPSDRFLRIHRSFLVNISEVTRIEPYEKTSHIAILRSGKKLQVSKSGYGLLKGVLRL